MNQQPLTYMEQLSINQGSGQNYGYIVYRKKDEDLNADSHLQIDGNINGAAMVVVDNELVSPPLKTINDFNNFGYWCTEYVDSLVDQVNLHW